MLEQLSHILHSTSFISAEISLVLGIVAIIILIAFGKKNSTFRTAAWALGLLTFIAAFFLVATTPVASQSIFNDLFISDKTSIFGKELTLLASIGIMLHIKVMKHDLDGEYYVILLAIVIGLFFLLIANSFISVFVSLETVSICSYILVAMNGKTFNLEASIKYLIFGAASTAIMLFGISFLYAATGSLVFNSEAYLTHIPNNANWVVLTAFTMTLAGPLFKLSAAPFHIWAPDVYEATPTPLVSFLAIAPKIGAVFLIYKLLQAVPVDTTLVLGLIILLSIVIGNFAALSQKNAKRMMGYSGIAQAGFILIGLMAFQTSGFQASTFYLAVYLFMSIGAFLMLDMISEHTHSDLFEDMAGLSQKFMLLGLIGLIFMIALVGLPPTSGFTSKFLVFSSIYEQYSSTGKSIFMWVLAFGLLNTAVSIYYYLKVPYFMFLKKPADTLESKSIPPLQLIYLSILAFIVLGLFFAPQWVQGLI
ncbi:NADH-quinone oxidoreductase subunit N [Arcticibacterium luteifluviistationis]|uniref:NADH-quinone oxidoreductase subunit N n=1 Tax=Arcticibacterium luteifluviistationis TaxID=1784714 RepID=A0A2Z4G9Y1_9BACT|nr:NADH-quinone oxidoreductase subunit N [Arcticibacterium luteifluviistationis]AWV97868.1 hypothetical protein DJ013_06675 [Arcticibacterium luteifluviistationis]